ncbi:MAG TPA: LytTR family DNA-binding domain-containing protein [Paludibacteraceae bacterium]|nr:LytTR family DNA-binding domain-containing protein [Paludibacteraceae bacterium]HOU68845.1 LytTR family DNA-binding domain-containing protein [Paludibacteraceae bacterium]HPH62137.1 LytTR family DNA-binding domain-containing protein [Paludibacteraceae bacterium]HQF50616.1 LytTR family DNA-binding domain-containing protein [Paludibacteraceae bacterium]
MENEQIKVLIIDDEFPARKLLSEYVSKIPNLTLCGACEDAMDAIKVMQQQPVDLILSDIQMPELSGLDFIRSLKEKPMVIFTTAYSEYAIDSYDLDAVDYLLKPIAFPRFMQAINKVVERMKAKSAIPYKAEKDFFMVKADYKLYRIDYADLLYIEGQSEYVTFHMKDKKKVTAYYSLKKLEEELPSNEFVRIHKSYIVAISKIESVEGNMLTVAGQKLAIGKNYKDSFLEMLCSQG